MLLFYQTEGKAVRNIQVIKEKNAVLVPMKQWEKVQNELIRLRKKANKEKFLRELKASIIELEEDLKRPPSQRKIRKTAEEFLAELQNAE